MVLARITTLSVALPMPPSAVTFSVPEETMLGVSRPLTEAVSPSSKRPLVLTVTVPVPALIWPRVMLPPEVPVVTVMVPVVSITEPFPMNKPPEPPVRLTLPLLSGSICVPGATLRVPVAPEAKVTLVAVKRPEAMMLSALRLMLPEV